MGKGNKRKEIRSLERRGLKKGEEHNNYKVLKTKDTRNIANSLFITEKDTEA